MSKKKEKNIIIVDENLPYLLNDINHPIGGASVQSKNWITGFKSNGFMPIIVSSANVFNKSKNSVEKIPSLEGLKKPLRLLNISFIFFKLIMKYKPSFVYLSTPYWSNLIFILPSKILGVKTVQRISNDNLVLGRSREKFGFLKFLLYRLGIRFCSIILCQNSYQESEFKSSCRRKKIFKIYNPFETNYLKLDKKKAEDRSYIAWIGLFQPQKNIPELYRIAKKFKKVKFKIAGAPHQVDGMPNGIIDSNTKIALEGLKNLKNVKFMGLVPRESIPFFLANAICLLNTSTHEGFSNTYLEALAVETPIVTRSVTDPDGIIKRNGLGLISNDYEGLVPLIEIIVDGKFNPCSSLSQYVSKNHSPEALAKKLLSIVLEN